MPLRLPAVEDGDSQTLLDRGRHKHNLKDHVNEPVEETVITYGHTCPGLMPERAE